MSFLAYSCCSEFPSDKLCVFNVPYAFHPCLCLAVTQFSPTRAMCSVNYSSLSPFALSFYLGVQNSPLSSSISCSQPCFGSIYAYSYFTNCAGSSLWVRTSIMPFTSVPQMPKIFFLLSFIHNQMVIDFMTHICFALNQANINCAMVGFILLHFAA